jgi:hypothetical protein
MRRRFLNFWADLQKITAQVKFLHAHLLKIPKAASEFQCQFSCTGQLSLVYRGTLYIIACFRNNFQDHSLTGGFGNNFWSNRQLSETRSNFPKEFQKGFSELVSVFLETGKA